MFPPIDYTAPPVNPAVAGLYAVATLINTTAATRISGGVQIQPVNCGGNAGTWPSNPCAVVPEGQLKTGTRPAPTMVSRGFVHPTSPIWSKRLGVWNLCACIPLTHK